jgi:7-carboxy-7-deazaguanine synthase
VSGAEGIDFVVITGGEPAVHDLTELTTALSHSFHQVHIETSGAYPLKGKFDWITLSPKKWKMPLEVNCHQADEFKLIIEKPEDIAFYTQALEEFFGPEGLIPVPIWLHPEWSQRKNPAVLDAIAKTVVSAWRGQPFRAGWQLHKLFAVDLADPRSRPPVPLGGDLKKGF